MEEKGNEWFNEFVYFKRGFGIWCEKFDPAKSLCFVHIHWIFRASIISLYFGGVGNALGQHTPPKTASLLNFIPKKKKYEKRGDLCDTKYIILDNDI